jgi:hypothetical protein
MISGLSAADVLAGGVRAVPRCHFARALSDPPLKGVVSPSHSLVGSSVLDVGTDNNSTATAAGALLGLHSEPVWES